MDIRSLQLFVHLANSLHFGKTAEAMHVSPSTLSRVIQRLEQDTGAVLLVRDNRSVNLTAMGEELRGFAENTLADWARLRAKMHESNKQISGELKLYCSVTASYSHLPPILDRFRSKFPQIEIILTTGDPTRGIGLVLENQVDMAIAVITQDFPSHLQFRHLDDLPLVLICPSSWKINQLDQLDWRHMPVILTETGSSKPMVEHWLKTHGISPKVYAHVSGHEAIVSMVALGCGMGVVPRVVVENSVAGDKVNMIPIPDMTPFRLGLVCQTERADEPLIQSMLNS